MRERKPSTDQPVIGAFTIEKSGLGQDKRHIEKQTGKNPSKPKSK